MNLDGCYDRGTGIYCCNRCGKDMKFWQKISSDSDEEGVTYVFRCKKCKNRIEIRFPKVDQV